MWRPRVVPGATPRVLRVDPGPAACGVSHSPLPFGGLSSPPPPPPRLLQAHPSAAVAPPLTLSSQARSRHAGAGVTPRDPHASPHVQLRPAQERPKVILLLYTEASQCPLGAHLPPPQQSPSRPLGALDPPQGPDPRMRGVIAARATGGAISSLPAPGQRGTRLCGEVTLAGQGQRATPPRPPGFVARARARAAGATRSSSRPRRPPAGAAGSRSCAPRGRGGPRSAAAAR